MAHHPAAPQRNGAAAEERLVTALRERGQRVTSQRLIIHRLLRELDRHVTAEEVLRRASEQLPGMSLPTVYATLDLLAELGEARRVSVGGPVLYDPRTEDHAHLRCRDCGRVEDLATPMDSAPALAAARAAGFQADTAELVVAGRCAACSSHLAGTTAPAA
ncbi:MAG: ferric uptake regulator, Fur family [Conexibacter sp.]|nr:ferric uptake regulator, Fur family [Conexibacter sp.]